MLSVFLRKCYCWFVCFLSGLFNLRGYDILHNVVFYAYAIVTRTSVRLVDNMFSLFSSYLSPLSSKAKAKGIFGFQTGAV